MKKYKIIYQEDKKIKEMILETIDIDFEKKPKNIIKITEEKPIFDINFLKKIMEPNHI